MATLKAAFNPQKYLKLIFALIGAASSTMIALGATGTHLSLGEMLNIAIAVVAAFQVWYVTETKDNPSGKAVIAFIGAGLAAALTAITTGGSFSLPTIMQILMAGVTATGILAVPSTAYHTPEHP